MNTRRECLCCRLLLVKSLGRTKVRCLYPDKGQKVHMCFCLEDLFMFFFHFNVTKGVGSRSQWPRCLRHELSSLTRTLWSWVRIPLKAWISVYAFILCLCCPVCRQRLCDGESYRLCKNDYGTEEEDKAQQRAVVPSKNEWMMNETSWHSDNALDFILKMLGSNLYLDWSFSWISSASQRKWRGSISIRP
jgi:hypothetical protein